MLFDSLAAFTQSHIPDHLRPLWHPGAETQLTFPGQEIRIPHDGNGSPEFHDTSYFPPLDTLIGLGVTGWNWADGVSHHVTIDLDSVVNHAAGHDHGTLDNLVQRLMLVDQTEIIRSKSGSGFHVRVYFDTAAPPKSPTRLAHLALTRRAMSWLASQVGPDLPDLADCAGVVAWIFHQQRRANGFEILKRSNAFMPTLDASISIPEPQADYLKLAETHPVTPKHQTLIDYLDARKWGEFDPNLNRLNTHTYHLLVAAEDKQLGIAGTFATLGTGKEGASGRNCYAFPAEGGAWKVYRHGRNVKEHSSWWTSSGGHTTTIFNKGKEAKADPTSEIFALAKSDDLFHDPFGGSYVSAEINGVKETMSVSDARYQYKLRLQYTGKTGRIVSGNQLDNALQQAKAEAAQNRPEYPVAIRLAAHDGKLYIDLSDRERRVVEVTGTGYRIVNEAPVRFLRPRGQLPLPLPLDGGTIDDLRPFVNVDPGDFPLLLALMIGAFHPKGPYVIGQICGEQGTAKSSLVRFIHDYVDPNVAVGNAAPEKTDDLLVIANTRHLVTFDNLSSLPKKLSDLLAMLVTGSAFTKRKNYSDGEAFSLQAKRPVVITAIANVIDASDLLDRTLTLVLPVIPHNERKSEFDLNQEQMREGVRGRIFGYLLAGVSAAIANHATTKLAHAPRMLDFMQWVTAAEAGLGLVSGSILDAFMRCQEEQSGQVADNKVAKRIIEICDEGFSGTATELANKVSLGLSARELSNRLREISPDLRRSGCSVTDRKSNGKKLIELGRA